MSLLLLPCELLVIILSDLSVDSVHSVLACKASCRRLHDVIMGSLLLKWTILNARCGIHELSFPGSVDNIFRYQIKWELDWWNFGIREGVMRSMSGPFQDTPSDSVADPDFLLRSGYLIHMRQRENPGWSHINLSLQRGLSGFITDPEWTNVHLGSDLKMEGSALDLDQDLVAALLRSQGGSQSRREIHLMHFTTGKCHKLATIPVVPLTFRGTYDDDFGTRIEIMGHYLVVLLAHSVSPRSWHRRHGYQTLYLVDWFKGRVICRQRFPENTYFPVLASISERTFVLVLRRDWALVLCRITKKCLRNALTIRRLRILKLPAIQQDTCVRLETLNRAPSGTNNAPALTCHSALPLGFRSSESILSFRVVASNKKKNAQSTLFFYAHPADLRALTKKHKATRSDRFSCLLSYLNPFRPTRRLPIMCKFIMPWYYWGPKTTRWLDVTGWGILHQSLSGNRSALSTPSGAVAVYFFPRRRTKYTFKDRRVVDVTEGSEKEGTITVRDCFKHNIVSKLPYYHRKGSGAKGRLFIDDQWVVQTQHEGGHHTILFHSVEERPVKLKQK